MTASASALVVGSARRYDGRIVSGYIRNSQRMNPRRPSSRGQSSPLDRRQMLPYAIDFSDRGARLQQLFRYRLLILKVEGGRWKCQKCRTASRDQGKDQIV